MKICTRCAVEKPLSEFPLCRGVPRARCKPCHSQDAMSWAAKNPEKYKTRLKKWHQVNNQPAFMGPPLPDHEKKRRRDARNAAWRAANVDRFEAMRKAWAARNPTAMLSRVRKRQAKLLSAMPKWANEFFIQEIYDLRARREKALGIPFEVDHIIPLQSKIVCGLHVEYNLRVIPKSVNQAKSNKFDDEHMEFRGELIAV